MNTSICRISTPAGVFVARFSARGLCELSFPGQACVPTTGKIAGKETGKPRELENWADATERAILSVLSGKAPCKLPPLDLSKGTDFQRKVWSAIAEIPSGQTRTYSQLAAQIGRPRASRAVGRACGANPIPLLIPCHRVLPACGGLGGFSAGTKWKKLLLEREGAGS